MLWLPFGHQAKLESVVRLDSDCLACYTCERKPDVGNAARRGRVRGGAVRAPWARCAPLGKGVEICEHDARTPSTPPEIAFNSESIGNPTRYGSARAKEAQAAARRARASQRDPRCTHVRGDRSPRYLLHRERTRCCARSRTLLTHEWGRYEPRVRYLSIQRLLVMFTFLDH